MRSLVTSIFLYACESCCLHTSSSVCLVFFPLSLCLARWFWPDLMNGRHVHTTSLCLFMMVRSLCGTIAGRILARTSSLVTRSLYEMQSILWQHLISMACILLCSSAVRVHDSQVYRKMDVTRERISHILELLEILLSFQTEGKHSYTGSVTSSAPQGSILGHPSS